MLFFFLVLFFLCVCIYFSVLLVHFMASDRLLSAESYAVMQVLGVLGSHKDALGFIIQ